MFSEEAISPIDGRYRSKISELAPFFSEAGLFKYRIIVEGEYLIALSENTKVGLREFSDAEKNIIRSLYEPSMREIKAIKKIEATTNHDVKSVEYFLKEKLKKTSLKDCLEWTHFALTSEDTNNLAYAMMLSLGVKDVILPSLERLNQEIGKIALENKSLAMLARTHGQSASPTTMGKELKIYNARLKRQLEELGKYRIMAKLNGATGNYNAHFAAYPKVKWEKFSVSFINQLNKLYKINLEPNLITAQIEPHDTYAELFDILRQINVIIIDFDQDVWRYISDGWIKQRAIKGEVGSSTMPHKINPIDFENSEGNLGMANALFTYFSNKLPISRLQRDLSDSTVERNFGTAFAYSLLAYKSTLKGLGKIAINSEKITADLNSHPEILAELIQIIFRTEGIKMPYEKLKDLTRGKEMTKEKIDLFVEGLSIDKEIKKKLKDISPADYIGIAESLVEL